MMVWIVRMLTFRRLATSLIVSILASGNAAIRGINGGLGTILNCRADTVRHSDA